MGLIAETNGGDVEAGMVRVRAEVFEHGGKGPIQAIGRFGIGDQISIVDEGLIAKQVGVPGNT